jgi:hypothetical protein
MTRSDVMASSRPRTVGAASTRRRRRAVSGLLVLPALLLALALAMPGIAAAGETYNEKTTPSSEPKPSNESTTSTTTTATETTPSTGVSPSTEKASTLPFTGFDLRWDIGFGLLLMGAGVSIVLVQRRQRRQHHKR